MNDHDESLIDKVKNAFGMGDEGDGHDEHDERRPGEEIDTERPIGEANRPGDEGIGDISGATEASGWQGAAGGTGSTAALGGAGAGGPVGTTGPTEDTDAPGGGADPGAVRTEYEMGHELDPRHESRAESGAMQESASGAGQFSAEPGGGAPTGTGTGTRGEAASGESPFADEEPDPHRPA